MESSLKFQNNEKLISCLQASALPIVICGAGIVGKKLLELCNESGIKVACFCDNSEKVAGASFCGLDVVLTRNLRNYYKNASLIISAAAIKDVVDLVEGLGFFEWCAGGILLEDQDVSQSCGDSLIDYEKFAIENCVLCHKGYLNPDKLFLRSIDLIITERCSLKCRDCSNLAQYYEKPADCEPVGLLKSVDRFFDVVDEVMDFRIIGGDAFMSRHWQTVVRHLANRPEARRIVLYTNGTIVPDQEGLQLLAAIPNCLIVITDYGELSRSLEVLRRKLQQYRIAHHILNAGEWLDCARIEPQERTAEQLSTLFQNCCAKNMPTLSDGKIYRCPYAANVARLGAAPEKDSDFVDIFSSNSCESIKSELRSYLTAIRFLTICDFCNGRPLSGPEVPAAVQTERPLLYKRYVST